jgi:kinesin family protein 3/17
MACGGHVPNRTTRDYDLPQVAPRIQAALDAALQDEEDIDIEGEYYYTLRN